MISFKLMIALYALIGLALLLDDLSAGSRRLKSWSKVNAPHDATQAFSACSRWLYVLRPNEKKLAVLDWQSEKVIDVLSLPFVPAAIRLMPNGCQVSVIAAGGAGYGELRMRTADLNKKSHP